jgi:DNA-binding MarR family transcriptional regulator
MADDALEPSLWDGTYEQDFVHTVALMGQVYRKVLEPLGLTTPQSTMLFRVAESDGLSQAELARRMDRDRANVTRIVANLVDKGLVQRRRDRKDRRIQKVFLTPRGRRTTREIRRSFRDASMELRAGITDQEIHALHAFVRKLQHNYRGFLDGPP